MEPLVERVINEIHELSIKIVKKEIALKSNAEKLSSYKPKPFLIYYVSDKTEEECKEVADAMVQLEHIKARAIEKAMKKDITNWKDMIKELEHLITSQFDVENKSEEEVVVLTKWNGQFKEKLATIRVDMEALKTELEEKRKKKLSKVLEDTSKEMDTDNNTVTIQALKKLVHDTISQTLQQKFPSLASPSNSNNNSDDNSSTSPRSSSGNNNNNNNKNNNNNNNSSSKKNNGSRVPFNNKRNKTTNQRGSASNNNEATNSNNNRSSFPSKQTKPVCNYCHRVGHTLKQCKFRSGYNSTITCSFCHRYGHHIHDCRQRIKSTNTTNNDRRHVSFNISTNNNNGGNNNNNNNGGGGGGGDNTTSNKNNNRPTSPGRSPPRKKPRNASSSFSKN